MRIPQKWDLSLIVVFFDEIKFDYLFIDGSHQYALSKIDKHF